jgi:outer membrane murein-binding lipoprotein Lpp
MPLASGLLAGSILRSLVVMAVGNDDVEARIARLESDVAHIRSDVADLKIDVRTLRDRVDTMHANLSERIDALSSQFSSLKDEVHSAKIWALLLYFALAGAMYATMARGFGWL